MGTERCVGMRVRLVACCVLGEQRGMILGDEMGMGKTYMSAAFLVGLMAKRSISSAIVVVPGPVVQNWVDTLRYFQRSKTKKAPEVYIQAVTSEMRKTDRLEIMERLGAKGVYAIIVTTYGLLGNVREGRVEEELCPGPHGKKLEWDIALLDEGHKIKNSSTAMHKRAQELR